ncbi:ABC transporter permease [Kitasatospora sp. NPDC101176]|uniref:ABC transporter permease n=1 Tax=Kitasatospora sp. NPDC101176 TaxID=3364099 RepID=UPI003810AD6E
MTSSLTLTPVHTPVGELGAAPRPATFLDAVAGEWIKLRTQRGLLITLVIGVAVTIAVGADNSAANARSLAKGGFLPGSDPTWITQAGMKFGLLAFAIAGTLAVTSEYGSGMIRTSLTAVPARGRLLAAKATVLTAVTLVAGLIASVASFAVGRSLIGPGVHLSPGDPGVLRALLGGGLCLATCGLLALGLGFVLRNAVAAVGAVFALYVGSLAVGSGTYLPFDAGLRITRAAEPHAWNGYLVLLVWAAAALAAAYVLLKRRDA